MNKAGFESWIKNSDLAEYSIGRYVGTPLIIDKWLIEKGFSYPPIYNINTVDIIEEIQEIEEFKVKNRKGGNMYGAALNHYKKFLDYKSELDEDVAELVFTSSIETQLSQIDRERIEVIDTQEEVPERVINRNSSFKRSPKKSAEAIIIANFTCEVNSNHRSFISKRTQENYCEGHHLVPMENQGSYNFSLDIHANIVSLCPNCHRILHHGIKEEKIQILTDLWQNRQDRLQDCGIYITLEELLECY